MPEQLVFDLGYECRAVFSIGRKYGQHFPVGPQQDDVREFTFRIITIGQPFIFPAFGSGQFFSLGEIRFYNG